MKTLKTLLVFFVITGFTACCNSSSNTKCEKSDKIEASDNDKNEKDIKIDDLSQVIKDNIIASYPGAEIEEAEEVTNEDGTIIYEVEIKLEGKEIELMYDAEGKFIGAKDDDGDDDGDKNDDDDDDDDDKDDDK